MKSHLLQWLLLISIFAYAKSLETSAKIVKIQQSTSTVSGHETETTTICLDATIPTDQVCILTVHSPEISYEGLEPTPPNEKCRVFNVLISTLKGDGIVIVKCGETPDTSILARANLKIPDITNVKAQLLKVADEEAIRVSGLTDPLDSWNVLVSDLPKTCTSGDVCFVFNSGITGSSDQVVVCATVPNTLVTDGSEKIDVCTDLIDVNLVEKEGPSLQEVTLIYDSNILRIKIGEAESITSYDVVASVGPTIKVHSNMETTSPIEINDDYTPAVQEINIFVAGVAMDVAIESQYVALQDYKLVATWFSSTIEMEWANIEETNMYYTEITKGVSAAFNSTDVDCNNLPNCYAYFIKVDDSENTVHVQPYLPADSKSEKNNMNIIEAEVKSTPTSEKSTGLRIQDIYLHWSSNILTVDARVCFHGEATELTQYQLVLVDSKGRWRRVHGASHTREGRLCFSRVTLDSRQFNTAEEVTVLVIKRDVDGRTVLTSGESHVFFITPKVEVVSAHVGLVSWDNPGGYTVSTRKESHPASVTDTTSGKLRHYFVPRRTGDKLVVKADASGVKIEAMVPLTRGEVTAAAGM